MRSVSIRQLDMKQATIPLGFEGENDFTEVRIDCKKTFDQHPNAVPSMTVTDPAGNKYPAVVTRDGDIVVWNITAGDLTTKGSGEIQIEFLIDGTIIGRTDVARTRIERSIFAEGEAPDPVQDWVSEANRLLALIRSAIPAGGTVGQFLGKKSNSDYDTEWKTPSGGGGGGTTNYNDLDNKPQIEGHTLTGNVTLETLGALSTTALAAAITTALAQAKASGEFDGADGHDGEDGQDGVGISNIAKTSTSGLVDTYTVTLTNGSTYPFTVTNGKDGTDGQNGQDGSDGSDGFSPTVSITTITGGHRISVTDKNGTQTFDVMDGVSAIDDTAGQGDTDKVLSADKVTEITDGLREAIEKLDPSATSGDVGKFLKAKTVSGGKVTEWELGAAGGGGSVDLFYVTPEDYGAVGDGETDDSQAVQDAVDAGYAVYFASDKTYYLASAVTINHDCHLFGGENTVIKTATPSGGTVNNAFVVSGTVKKTTTLTSDYASTGDTDNSGNQFELSDMDGIEIGDIMVITAEGQYYSYARPNYYLGATLLIGDIYNDHLYTTNSMPWDIENTENVTVKVYSAPTAIIENLNFVSDLDSLGAYRYFIELEYCKNSIVRNCNMTQMANGLRMLNCVNTLVDCVTVSKSKYDNNIQGDGYGIFIGSCSDTIIQRVLAICSQGCLDLGGEVPNINTYVKNCNLTSECRSIGIDMHENSYNIVIEDCTFGGLSLYGTATVNRCRFIRNNRSDAVGNAIMFRGSHNPEWARLKVNECIFDYNMVITLDRPIPQSPVQSFENVIGSAEFTNCKGGTIAYNPTTTEVITANIIKTLILKNWSECLRFYHTSGNVVEYMMVEDCTFRNNYWSTDNNTAHGIYLDYIQYLDFYSANPWTHKVHMDSQVKGASCIMPEGIDIQLSSSNPSTAKYLICGKNLVSDNIADYVVGNISGSVGGTLSRSLASGSGAPSIAFNGNGDIVYTQGGTTGNFGVCMLGMVYAKEMSTFKISATLKNTGGTDGAAFYPYIAIVDCETGKVTYRGNGSKKTASAEGVAISHEYTVRPNNVVIGYFYCSTAYANAQSTFEDLSITLTPWFAPAVIQDTEAYNGKRMTGDGTIKSIKGVNNIMSYEADFNVKWQADVLSNAI